jgi:hypothetical protein
MYHPVQPSEPIGSLLSSRHTMVVSQVPSYDHFTLIVLLYWLSLSSTVLGVDSLQAMSFWSHTWLRVSILFSFQKNIIFGRAEDRFSLEVLTRLGMSSMTSEFEKDLFYSKHPLELMGQEDQVMKRDTSRVMEYYPILHGAMSFMHGKKSGMDD